MKSIFLLFSIFVFTTNPLFAETLSIKKTEIVNPGTITSHWMAPHILTGSVQVGCRQNNYNLSHHLEKNPKVEGEYYLIFTLSYETVESTEPTFGCLSFQQVNFEVNLGDIPLYKVSPLKGQFLMLE